MEKTGRKVFSSAVLIFLGIIFLLNNFNLLPRFIWFAYIRFWPIYLIVIGLRLLFPQKAGLGVLALLLALVLPLVFSITPFGQNLIRGRSGGSWEYDYIYPGKRNDPFENGKLKTYSGVFSWDKNEQAKRGKFKADFGAGDLTVREGTDKLASFSYWDSYPEPSADYREEGEEIVLSAKGERNVQHFGSGLVSNRWLFELNPNITWELELDVGACKGNIDLEKIPVKKLDFNAGASSFTLRLGSLSKETEIDIEAGVSNIVLELPEALGIKAKVDGALTAKNDSFANWDKKGEYYYSPGYSEDKSQVNLNVSLGVGNFKLITY